MIILQGDYKSLNVNRFTFFLLVLVVWEIVSLFWSYSAPNAIKFSTLSIVSLFVVLGLSQKGEKSNLAFLIRLNSVVITLYMVVALLQILKQGWDPYVIHGLSLNKNLLAGFLILSLPVSLISLRRSESRLPRALYGLVIVFSLLFIIVIQSRATYLSLLLFIVLGAFFAFRQYSGRLFLLRLKQYYLIPLSVLAGAMLYLGIVDRDTKEDFIDKINISNYFSKVDHGRITEVTENNYESIESRKILWKSSLKLISEKPAFGFGKGNWSIAVGKYATAHLPDRISRNKSFSHTHNDYLQQFAETGLLGFLLFILPILVLLFLGYRSILFDKQNFEIRLVTVGLTAFLVFTFFDFPFQQVESRVLFYFQLLILYQLLAGTEKIISRTVFRVNKYIIIFSGVIFCGLSMVQLRSDFHALKAVQREDVMEYNEALHHLEKAKNSFYDITPTNFPVDYLIGRIMMKKDKYYEAFPYVESALKTNPFEVRILNDYGMLLSIQGNHGKSMEAFQKASLLAPTFEDPKFNMAATYYNEKQYAKALEVLKAVDDSPKKRNYIHQIKFEMNSSN